MSDLSQTSKAVMQAATNGNSYCMDDAVYKQCIASALRAAVNEVKFFDQLGLTAYGGYAQAQRQILAIAEELSN
jgi:hypothetical protein